MQQQLPIESDNLQFGGKKLIPPARLSKRERKKKQCLEMQRTEPSNDIVFHHENFCAQCLLRHVTVALFFSSPNTVFSVDVFKKLLNSFISQEKAFGQCQLATHTIPVDDLFKSLDEAFSQNPAKL